MHGLSLLSLSFREFDIENKNIKGNYFGGEERSKTTFLPASSAASGDAYIDGPNRPCDSRYGVGVTFNS